MSLLCQKIKKIKKLSSNSVLWLGSRKPSNFLLKGGGLCYLVLIPQIFPHWFLLFLNMDVLWVGKSWGWEQKKAKNLPVVLLFVHVFKQWGLSGENRAWVLHYKTTVHVKCGFRCKLCNFLGVAGLLGEDLLRLGWMWAPSSPWQVRNPREVNQQRVPALTTPAGAVCWDSATRKDAAGKRRPWFHGRVYQAGRACFSPGTVTSC